MGRKESNKKGGFRKLHKAKRLKGATEGDLDAIERLKKELLKTKTNE